MSNTIFFDGLNLSLKRGTGVATYTRVLVHLARTAGHRSGILYSRRYRSPRESLRREIEFFDAEMRLPKYVPDVAGGMRLLATSLTGVWPQRIPVSGAVLTAPLGTSWVPCDEVYSAFRVFNHARALFALSGSFLKVHFPERADLFHWTYPLPLKANARANIYTIHDLVPLRLPYASLDWKKLYLRTMRKVVRKADHIVTVSESSKRDIMTYLGIEEKRITNTYEASDIPAAYATRSDDDVAAELEGMFGLGFRNYLLFYGSLEPKKNIGRIVQAYLAAKVDIPLVVVFAQAWLVEDEIQLLNQVVEREKNEVVPRAKKQIHSYEYLPFRTLATLIKGARAVLFPSLYEGFGLPLLEGMMLGTPVITSNVSSLPEVAGDAALLVDPHSVDSIKAAIRTVCNDTDLCAELSVRGLKRAQHFSVEAYGERMAKLYCAFI